VRIDRVWAMPNAQTFLIKPIAVLLREEMDIGLWIDSFAGENSPAIIRNDLNPQVVNVEYHLDAIDFLRNFGDGSIDGVLLDPPYSPRQVSECYKGFGRKATQEDTLGVWRSWVRDEVTRITHLGSKVISFGWNSCGIGKERGFRIDRILLVCHGQTHNDTIVTVETKERQVKCLF